MKKILIVILIIALAGTAYLIFNSSKVDSKSNTSKKQLKVLLSKPDNEKKYSYVLLDDYENNRKKKSEGIDFISGINKNRKNPYNAVSSEATKVNVEGSEEYDNSNSDVLLLARLIQSEAENQPYVGKLAVGSVVMNRCRINGNTVSQTIYASGQFDGVNTELFNKKPSSEDIRAAQQVLAGANMIQNAYYYANLKLCDPEFAKEDKFITRIGDHWFFRR